MASIGAAALFTPPPACGAAADAAVVKSTRPLGFDAAAPHHSNAGWMAGLGHGPKIKTAKGKKRIKSSTGVVKASKSKRPLPGTKVFEGRQCRHKYRAKGMRNMWKIRMKRLAKLVKKFRGKRDLVARDRRED